MPRKSSPTTESEEANSHVLRRSNRIGSIGTASPAGITRRRGSETKADTPIRLTRRRLSAQESEENVETKPTPKARRVSLHSEVEPQKESTPSSRRGRKPSITAEDKEVDKPQSVRGRRSSASEKTEPKEDKPQKTRSRRSSLNIETEAPTTPKTPSRTTRNKKVSESDESVKSVAEEEAKENTEKRKPGRPKSRVSLTKETQTEQTSKDKAETEVNQPPEVLDKSTSPLNLKKLLVTITPLKKRRVIDQEDLDLSVINESTDDLETSKNSVKTDEILSQEKSNNSEANILEKQNVEDNKSSPVKAINESVLKTPVKENQVNVGVTVSPKDKIQINKEQNRTPVEGMETKTEISGDTLNNNNNNKRIDNVSPILSSKTAITPKSSKKSILNKTITNKENLGDLNPPNIKSQAIIDPKKESVLVESPSNISQMNQKETLIEPMDVDMSYSENDVRNSSINKEELIVENSPDEAKDQSDKEENDGSDTNLVIKETNESVDFSLKLDALKENCTENEIMDDIPSTKNLSPALHESFDQAKIVSPKKPASPSSLGKSKSPVPTHLNSSNAEDSPGKLTIATETNSKTLSPKKDLTNIESLQSGVLNVHNSPKAKRNSLNAPGNTTSNDLNQSKDTDHLQPTKTSDSTSENPVLELEVDRCSDVEEIADLNECDVNLSRSKSSDIVNNFSEHDECNEKIQPNADHKRKSEVSSEHVEKVTNSTDELYKTESINSSRESIDKEQLPDSTSKYVSELNQSIPTNEEESSSPTTKENEVPDNFVDTDNEVTQSKIKDTESTRYDFELPSDDDDVFLSKNNSQMQETDICDNSFEEKSSNSMTEIKTSEQENVITNTSNNEKSSVSEIELNTSANYKGAVVNNEEECHEMSCEQQKRKSIIEETSSQEKQQVLEPAIVANTSENLINSSETHLESEDEEVIFQAKPKTRQISTLTTSDAPITSNIELSPTKDEYTNQNQSIRKSLDIHVEKTAESNSFLKPPGNSDSTTKEPELINENQQDPTVESSELNPSKENTENNIDDDDTNTQIQEEIDKPSEASPDKNSSGQLHDEPVEDDQEDIVEPSEVSPDKNNSGQLYDEPVEDDQEDIVAPSEATPDKNSSGQLHDESVEDDSMDEMEETTSEDESVTAKNEFIDDMAEEGEEDTPSEDSNQIIDEGESIGSTDSNYGDSDDESYSSYDSFICDEEQSELLSGEEYDLSYEFKESKKKHKRIIDPNTLGDESIIKIPNKKEEEQEKPKKRNRIIVHDSSSEEQDLDNSIFNSKESTKPNATTKYHHTDNSIITIEDSRNEEVDDTKIQVPVKDNVEEKPESNSQLKHKTRDVADQTVSSISISVDSQGKPRKSSLTIQENIIINGPTEPLITKRINSLVESFCSSVSKGEIALNLSLDYEDLEDTPSKHKIIPVLNDIPDTSNNDLLEAQRNKSVEKESELNISIDKNDLRHVLNKKSQKRRLSNSVDDLSEDIKVTKKHKKNKFKKRNLMDDNENTKSSKKIQSNDSAEPPVMSSFSIFDQLITDVKNRPKRLIKPSTSYNSTETTWTTTKAKNLKPSTSIVSKKEIIRFNAKLHPKDFKNQMLAENKKAKRIETKVLLRKKGVF